LADAKLKQQLSAWAARQRPCRPASSPPLSRPRPANGRR
jgi:hypothetical protein